MPVLTSECRRPQCGPGTGRCTQAGVEYPPSKHRGWENKNGQNIYSSLSPHIELRESMLTMQNNQGSQTGYSLRDQRGSNTSSHLKTTGPPHTYSPSLSFGNTVLGAHGTSSLADKWSRTSSGIWRKTYILQKEKLLGFRAPPEELMRCHFKPHHMIFDSRHQGMGITFP